MYCVYICVYLHKYVNTCKYMCNTCKIHVLYEHRMQMPVQQRILAYSAVLLEVPIVGTVGKTNLKRKTIYLN